jgi:hypothetical protein
MSYQSTNELRTNEAEVGEDGTRKIIIIVAIFFLLCLVLGLVGQAFAQSRIEGSNVSYTSHSFTNPEADSLIINLKGL